METDTRPDTTSMATALVAAYVAKNSLPAAELGALLVQVHSALAGLYNGVGATTSEQVERATPAQIKRSITPDALISFIDGKPYKALKRHLTTNRTTPDEYRARYGLPADYPLVAAGYSAARSALAKSFGLGNNRRKPIETTAATETATEIVTKPKRAARSRKATEPE